MWRSGFKRLRRSQTYTGLPFWNRGQGEYLKCHFIDEIGRISAVPKS